MEKTVDGNQNIEICMSHSNGAQEKKYIYEVLRFENEDSNFWYFTLKNKIDMSEKWWAFPRKKRIKNKVEIGEDGKKKLIPQYEDAIPSTFLNVLRNRAIVEGTFQPWEKDETV